MHNLNLELVSLKSEQECKLWFLNIMVTKYQNSNQTLRWSEKEFFIWTFILLQIGNTLELASMLICSLRWEAQRKYN